MAERHDGGKLVASGQPGNREQVRAGEKGSGTSYCLHGPVSMSHIDMTGGVLY